MGTRAGLRMELNTEDRSGFVSESSNGAIIQVPMGHLPPGRCQGNLIDAKTVILACDLDPPREFITNRLVGPSVAEFKFPGLRPEGEGQQLMAQTDPESRDLARDFPESLHRGLNRRRVTGAVGDEQAMDLSTLKGLLQIGRRGVVRHETDLAASLHQMAIDVPLRAAIQRDHHEGLVFVRSDPDQTRPSPEILGERARIRGPDLRRQIASTHGLKPPSPIDELGIRNRCVGFDHPPHRAFGSEDLDQGPRIQILDAWNARLGQPVVQVA